MKELLVKMFIFVVLMGVGYFLARKGDIDSEFARKGSRLALNVFIFATILSSAISSESDLSETELFVALGTCFITAFLCYVFGFLAVLPFKSSKTAAVSELIISTPNMMFIGAPVVQVLYGPLGVLYLALSCLPFNILVYTYGAMRLKGNFGSRFRLRELVTPPSVATLIAVIVLLADIRVPAIFTELISTTAAATVPFSMVVIGASLGTLNVKGLLGDWRIYAASFVRLIVSPILAWFLLSFIVPDPVLLGSMVVYAACPTGIVVSILAMQYENEPVYASKGVLMTTVLSMLTIPLIVYLLPI